VNPFYLKLKQLILAEFKKELSDKCTINVPCRSFEESEAIFSLVSLLNNEQIEVNEITISNFFFPTTILTINKSSLRACKSVDPFIQDLRTAAGIPTLPSSSRTLNQITVGNILPQTSLPELDENTIPLPDLNRLRL
jgi:hypothetical protein